MILIVTYDLKGPSTSYSGLYEILKAQQKWMHYISSTWLIVSQKTPTQLVEDFRPYIKPGDRVLIARLEPHLGNTANGWLPKDAWEWIQKNS